MAFIEVKGLGDDYEDRPVPEDTYTLRIRQIKEQTAKDGVSDQIVVIIEIDSAEFPDAASIFHYLTFPSGEDSDDVRRTKMRMNARFLKLFDVPFEKNGLNSEDMVGCEADDVLVKKSEIMEKLEDGSLKGTGAFRNEIVMPRISE